MIKAVIYDVDGTIVDSEPLHVKAWDIALQFYNHHLTDLSESFRATMAGKKPANIAKEMTDELNLQIDSQNLLQKKTEIFMNLIKTDLQPMPGLKKSIENLKHDGYKLGIGTSQMRDYIYLVLHTLHVFEFFDVVFTGDEIKNGKPHPETYQVVAQKLKVQPKECLVIEDAQSGIESAKAADCLCIAIKNPHALSQNTSQADKIISSLDEITDKLIQELDSHRN